MEVDLIFKSHTKQVADTQSNILTVEKVTEVYKQPAELVLTLDGNTDPEQEPRAVIDRDAIWGHVEKPVGHEVIR